VNAGRCSSLRRYLHQGSFWRGTWALPEAVSSRDPSRRNLGVSLRRRADWSCRQFYAGGQKMNQAVSPAETRAAAKLPLTTLSAMPLTGGELLVVATAASVATITNAMAIIEKITSIIPVP
jgi:hypothetical protein